MTLRERVGVELPSVLSVVLFVGLPFALLARGAAPLVGAGGVFLVLVVSFGELARTDQRAFLSIAIPSGAVALLGLVIPWRLAIGLDEGVAVFLALFTFAPGNFVPWWWRVVLRRPNIAFAIRLSSQVREVGRLSGQVLTGTSASGQALAALGDQLVRLRNLTAPDPDWTELRDAQADEFERILELGRRSASAQEFQDETGRAQALRARFDELVARG